MWQLTTFDTLTSLLPPSAEETIQACFQNWLTLHTAAERHYHNRQHIENTLKTAALLQPLAKDYTAVQLALWFHDAIYDSQTADNEEQSAALATQWLTTFGLQTTQITHIEQLILATKTHTPTSIDGQIVVDADLAILGADPAVYAQYSAAIRQEYGWVPEETYRRGRAQVLGRFLNRPKIYHTHTIFQTHEAQARHNLQVELKQLHPTA